MKSKRKMLQLTLEYDTTKDAIEAIEKMLNDLRRPRTNFNRETVNGAVIEWGITISEIDEYRFESMNGKQCIILPSKMNLS